MLLLLLLYYDLMAFIMLFDEKCENISTSLSMIRVNLFVGDFLCFFENWTWQELNDKLFMHSKCFQIIYERSMNFWKVLKISKWIEEIEKGENFYKNKSKGVFDKCQKKYFFFLWILKVARRGIPEKNWTFFLPTIKIIKSETSAPIARVK
jgi:hypothetical protein